MLRRLKQLLGKKTSEKAYKMLEFPFNLYALLLSRYGEVKYLHYGFWDDDSDIPIVTAQEKLTERLYSLIPPRVHSILDVGCGLGATVCELLDRGYDPEGISPDEGLVKYAKAIHSRCRDRFYLTAFENYEKEKPYDLLLFCESAQYIKDKEVLFNRAKGLLKSGGHILLCDEFLKRGDERADFHVVSDFIGHAENSGFEILFLQDITQNVIKTRYVFYDAVTAQYDKVIKNIHEDTLKDFIDRWRTQTHMYEDGTVGYFIVLMRLRN